MAENYPKSKLKRKKSCVEKLHPEICSRAAAERANAALFSSDITAGSDGSLVPAAVWWNREQLPAAESLWAFTLKSALPYLENQHWDLVPDLPHPSPLRPTAPKLDEQRWCDLREKVTPLPEPAPPSPSTLPSPDPLRLSSSQQNLAVPHSSDGQLSSHGRQSHDSEAASHHTLTKRQRPSLHNWEEAKSSAGCSTVGGEEGRKGGEQGDEAGLVIRQLLTQQVKTADSRVCLQREHENREEVVKDEEEEEGEEQGSVKEDGAGGGGELQSCPMCLLVFPVGFTQMDCDGHLAQCLSEMNVDMTW